MRSRGLLMATEAFSLSDGCKPTTCRYTHTLRGYHTAVFILAHTSAQASIMAKASITARGIAEDSCWPRA